MARELEAIRSAGLDKALASPHETFAALRQTAEKLASVMIAETMDWSFVFRYRTLNLPG
jgi:plasmid maintenance system killer protein